MFFERMFFVISKIKKRVLACLLTATFAVGNILGGGFSCAKVNAATASIHFNQHKDAPAIDEPYEIPEVMNALSESIKDLRDHFSKDDYYALVDDREYPLNKRYCNVVIDSCYGTGNGNEKSFLARACEFYDLRFDNPLIIGCPLPFPSDADGLDSKYFRYLEEFIFGGEEERGFVLNTVYAFSQYTWAPRLRSLLEELKKDPSADGDLKRFVSNRIETAKSDPTNPLYAFAIELNNAQFEYIRKKLIGATSDKGPFRDLVNNKGEMKDYDGSPHYDDFLKSIKIKLEPLKNCLPDGLLPKSELQCKDDWDGTSILRTNCKGLRYIYRPRVDQSGYVNGNDYLSVSEYPLVNVSIGAYGEYLKHLVIRNPDYTPDELFSHPQVKQKLNMDFGGFFYESSMMDDLVNAGNAVSDKISSLISSFGNTVRPFAGVFGSGNNWDSSDDDERDTDYGHVKMSIGAIASDRQLRSFGIYPAGEIAVQFYYTHVASFGARTARKARATAGIAGVASPYVVLGAVFWKLFNWTVSQMGIILNHGAIAATKEFLRERNKLLNDPVKLRDAIKRMMKQGVVGLTDTIDKLTTLVTGSLALRKCSNLLNKNHCQLIAFIGPPGTGKSLLAQRYAIALTGKPIPNWGYITSASIKPGVSPSEQFFNSNSELVQNLKKSNGNTVIFIDEIDKFDSNQLLENLRDAVDKGTMVATSENTEERPGLASTTTSKVIRTESINVSGLIVIVGTNERPECWGLEPDPDRPEYTVGRTVVERSGSIVQRFQRFKFNPYTVDEYKQMYDNALNAILPEAVKMFGLHIVFDENLSKELAKESELRLMGGRSVPILLSEMAGAITSYNVNTNPDSLSFMSRIMNKMLPNRNLATLRISFDSASHRFKISEEPTQSRDKSSKAKSESVKLKAETAKVKSIKQTA